MKLSISNIAWDTPDDEKVYGLMKELGFTGLEIAPTRIFPDRPYEQIVKAREWKKDIYERYGFRIPSMQSIWYGRQEKLFGTEEEREILLSYTKKAVDFAEAVGCGNLVFGCPKNRMIPDEIYDRVKGIRSPGGSDDTADIEAAGKITDTAVRFFKEIGDYACEHHTVIAMEANPKIYNTNFINTTQEALELIGEVGSDGFKLNLDTGTMIENNESPDVIREKGNLINHVHISEPYLKPIGRRSLHRELINWLREIDYQGWVSIETGRNDGGLDKLHEMMGYLAEEIKV